MKEDRKGTVSFNNSFALNYVTVVEFFEGLDLRGS